MPGHILISPDGRRLVATRVGPNAGPSYLDGFSIGSDGRLTPAAGSLPTNIQCNLTFASDVLDKQDYRSRAKRMADEFGAIDTRSEILRTINELAQDSSAVAPRRVKAKAVAR